MAPICRTGPHPQTQTLITHTHITVVTMTMTLRLRTKRCRKKSAVSEKSTSHVHDPSFLLMNVTSDFNTSVFNMTVFFYLCSLAHRHMLEIQALQNRQKEEIESLFTRMGKPPPPSVFSPAVAMAGGRRRLKSKNHKSARSSGQPSPVHSGKDNELFQGFVHFEVNTTTFLCFMYILNQFNLKLCVQDLHPQLRVFMVQSRLQSKVHPQQQGPHKQMAGRLYNSSDPLHPCPVSAVAPQVCASTSSRHTEQTRLNLFP